MMEALATTLLATDESYAVELWLYDRYHQQRPEAYAELLVEHLQQTLGLRASVEGDSTSFVPPADEAQHRAHAAYEMLRKLDARRAELEHRLVEALTSTSDDQTDAWPRVAGSWTSCVNCARATRRTSCDYRSERIVGVSANAIGVPQLDLPGPEVPPRER